jgi:hypothetical protein
VDEQFGSFHVPEKGQAKPDSLRSAFNEPWDIRHHKGAVIFLKDDP